MPLKHYLYVSRPKIDALFEQIDHSALRRTAKTLKIDLKIVSAELSTPGTPDTGHSRLRMVLRKLADDDILGVVGDAEPKPYVAGRMNMRTGTVQGTLLIYGGVIAGRAVFLGGSYSNMIGADKTERPTLPREEMRYPVQSSEPSGMESTLQARFKTARVGPASFEPQRLDFERPPDDFDTRVFWEAHKHVMYYGVTEDVEFVARRLLFRQNASGAEILIGTPLYLALTD